MNNKQDFLSGRVIKLIKETQKNIQAYRQQQKKERKKNEKNNITIQCTKNILC